MNKQATNKLGVMVIACCLAIIPASVAAGPDEFQRQMIHRIQQAKQKLKEAELDKSSERQKLMGEHMKMMQESMEKMRAMKPRAGMTMQEHENWINEHQKLMEEVMSLLMEEHRLLMDMYGSRN